MSGALIEFDATGDPLALLTTLALLSTFVYVFGYVLSVAVQRGTVVLCAEARPERRSTSIERKQDG